MLSIQRWKFWGIIMACFLGLIFASPNVYSPAFLQKMPAWFQKTINLGLELRGGSHLQFEVDLKTVNREYLTTLLDDARASLRKEQIGYIGLKVDPKSETPVLKFSLRHKNDGSKAVEIISKIDKELEVRIENGIDIVATLSQESLKRRNKNIIEQSIEVIRRRIDESGTKEPNIQRQGDDRILVQLPGIDNPAEVKRLIGKTAKMSFRLVDASVPVIESNAQGVAPLGSEYLVETQRDGTMIKIAVKRQIMVSGDTLLDAQATTDEYGQPAVSLRFNAVGARKFAEMSTKNLQKQFAMF